MTTTERDTKFCQALNRLSVRLDSGNNMKNELKEADLTYKQFTFFVKDAYPKYVDCFNKAKVDRELQCSAFVHQYLYDQCMMSTVYSTTDQKLVKLLHLSLEQKRLTR